MDDRTLEALGLSEAPRDHPLAYPGAWPAESGLLHQNRFLRLTAIPHQRLAEWLVEQPHRGFHHGVTERAKTSLRDALSSVNQTPIEDRFPVISVGSNACPAQLLHKMEGLDVSSTIPIVKARVTGIDIGVSAYVSPIGYVSSSPFYAPGVSRDLYVTWLDTAQLNVIDASEGVSDTHGEYDRVLLEADTFPMKLESGELLGAAYLYVHRYGVIRDASGRPRPHLGERQLLTDLLAESTQLRTLFGETPEDFSRRARGNDHLCAKGTRLFADEGRVTNCGLRHLVAAKPSRIAYDEI